MRQRAEGLEQELASAWEGAQAQRQRAAALTEDLRSAWAEAQEQRARAASLADNVAALQAQLEGVPCSGSADTSGKYGSHSQTGGSLLRHTVAS